MFAWLNKIFSFNKTVKFLQDRLVEEGKKSKRLNDKIKQQHNTIVAYEKTIELLKKSNEIAKHKFEQEQLVKTMKMWLREIITDFTLKPFKSKLQNWNERNALGNISMTYIFSDNIRIWKIETNDFLKDVTSITMINNKEKESLQLTVKDEIAQDVFKVLLPLKNHAVDDPMQFAEFDVNDIAAEIDKALEARDFAKVELLRKELEKKQK